jgi:glyoxylase-like metal-dependent hydrolase (beta-lactamase superfamily II)
MQVRRLYVGHIAGPLGPATPFNCHLIEHPDGLVLIDTGFGETLGGPGPAGELVMGERRLPWLRRHTAIALADHGFEPGDVRYIINTHLGDHSGDNAAFPEATFIIQRPEADHVRKLPPSNPRRIGWDFPGARIELLAGEDARVLPGLTCLFTPGHTPGHQSVLLEDAGTTTLFVGDAVYTLDFWNDLSVVDEKHPAYRMQIQVEGGLELWRSSAAKLKAIRADVVHFAHDSASARAASRVAG